MECKKLMLDDYVRVISTGEIVRVTEIGSTLVTCGTKVLEYSEIEPILLTVDFMRKMISDNSGIIWYDLPEMEGFYICSGDSNDYGVHIGVNVEVRYVHELQHWMRMLNINKEIEL